MVEEQVTLERERGFLPETEGGEVLEVAPESPQDDEAARADDAAGHDVPQNVVSLDAHRVREEVPVVASPKDNVLEQVEAVLSEGLEDVYKELPEGKKRLFRTRGEEAAKRIAAMIRSGKPRVYKTTKLIHAWLKLIPNVNRYYLRQETKLKVDDVVKLDASTDSDMRLAA